MKRTVVLGWVLGGMLVGAGGSLAHAGAAVDRSFEGCKRFEAAGSTNSAFVSLAVYEPKALAPIARVVVPVVGGSFDVELDLPRGLTRGDQLQYAVWGATNANGDWDGGSQYDLFAPCDSFSRAEQRCIGRVNDAWDDLFWARNRANENCIEGVGSDELTLGECWGEANEETRPLVMKASDKLIGVFQSRTCDDLSVLPVFGLESPSAARSAGIRGPTDAADYVFGTTPTIADPKIDPDAARCQEEAAEQMTRIGAATTKSYVKAAKRALAGDGGHAAVQEEEEFANRVLELELADGSVERAFRKAERALLKACRDVSVQAYFECLGADDLDDLIGCVQVQAYSAGCSAASGVSDVLMKCIVI